MLKTYTNNPNFVPKSSFLSSEAMIEMYDGRPVACVDILLVNRKNKTVLLPTRKFVTAGGLWFIGGGIKRDQDLSEAAAKALQRETGLEVAADRFEFLTVNRFVWDHRDEAPEVNGRVDINFCFLAELTKEELATLQLNEKEYDTIEGLNEYTREELVESLKDENPVKQVLIDYYDMVFPVQSTE